ncbi:MAG: hypothetical protein ABII00_17845 [Elusimicrobiota bacterium]
MPLFDLFGIKKDLKGGGEEESEPAEASGPAGGGSGSKLPKRAWGLLLALDALLILLCVGVLAARAYHHLTAPSAPPLQARAPAPPKKAPAPAPEPEAKPPAEPATKKPAPEKKAPKEPKAPAAKKAPAKPKPADSGKAIAEKKGKKKRVTRPVSFTYVDASAKEVSLLGMFLVRANGRKPMFKDSKGAWQTTVYLNIGVQYRYQFEVVDAKGQKKITAAQTVDVFE